MAVPRRAILGFALAGLGFGLWGLKAASVGETGFAWLDAVRMAAGLAAGTGLLAMARGRSTALFRAGAVAFLAVACVTLVLTFTSALNVPDVLSTLLGFAGAAAAAYGAWHWTEPAGDTLVAWWVGTGAVLMAGNPGTYLAASLLGGDLWAGGWMPGSVLACAGFVLVAVGIREAVDASGAGAPRAGR